MKGGAAVLAKGKNVKEVMRFSSLLPEPASLVLSEQDEDESSSFSFPRLVRSCLQKLSVSGFQYVIRLTRSSKSVCLG